jgi:hypothetical protein
MNQINLDKLLQLAPAGKADTAALKLMIAQVYQGQIQQLSDGTLRIQLPSTQGPLQVNLPATASSALQRLLPTAAKQPAPKALQSQAERPGQSQFKLPLQVTFEPKNNDRILLSLHSVATPLTLAVQPAQLRQLLFAAYTGLPAVTPNQSRSKDSSTALVTAQLQNHSVLSAIQLPRIPPLPISAQIQAGLTHLLSTSHASPLTVQLALSNTDTEVSANVLLPGTRQRPGNSSLISKPQQVVLLQQLVKMFNQLHLKTIDVARLNVPDLKPLLGATPATGVPYILQLQAKGNQFQLQLLPQNNALTLTLSREEFNRPIDFISNTQQASIPQQASSSGTISPHTLQHAWRHLLPLMPPQTDALASLPELPESAQQILQLIRSSQPDASNVLTVKQLLPQLQSLIQFQPLQANASVQTAGGALAVAIQLLLGHLLQKPQPATNQPANQKLLQLVQNLEPAQASSLLRQLASHSSALQQSQLATLDSNANAQQHVLLQLPLQHGAQSVLSQIQLEQREAEGSQQGEKHTQWQLTMKFDLQQRGPLLVVAKLQQQQLHLQLYTEQASAKQLADKFLPILKHRCTLQGLEIRQADCMLGKIPDSLLPRANSLLAIKA